MQVAYIGIKGLPSRAGADRVVEAIVTRLAPLGVQATVYCDRARSVNDAVPGVRLLRLRVLPGKHLRPLSLNLLAGLHALVFGRYDLIHLHHLEAGFLLPILRLRYRVVSTSHGFAYRRAKWSAGARFFMRLSNVPFTRLSTAITSVSAQHARELQEQYGCQVLHIPNGTAPFRPAGDGGEVIRARHGLSPGRYFLLVAGRIDPTKGVHLALAAVNRLNMPLLVVGDDGQVPAYTQQLREMAGANVRFQSFVDEPAVLTDLMSHSTCLIHPSLFEGMSMVLLEAATAGAPIVCSDIQENREVLGNDGMYFRSGDAEALAGQLEWVLDHEEIAVRRARSCSLRVQQLYSWDAIVPRYVEVYRRASKGGVLATGR